MTEAKFREIGREVAERRAARREVVPWRFAQVTDVVAYHGEGPVWSPRWGQDALQACALASALSLTSFPAWVR